MAIESAISVQDPARSPLVSSDVHPVTFVERQRLQEKCGITALLSKIGEPVGPLLITMQEQLNHRGEDNAGIVARDQNTGKPIFQGGSGKVADAFPCPELLPVTDRMIGHNRYGTSGGENKHQPVIAEVGGKWIAVAHNGNIPDELREQLRKRIPKAFHKQLTFDSAEIAYAIASAPGDTWSTKIAHALEDVSMAYALTMLTDTGDVFGLVGPSGHWPLWLGENDQRAGLASETRAFSSDMTLQRIRPGQLVQLTEQGAKVTQLFSEPSRTYACALHEVYGAKSDSFRTESQKYSEVRENIGHILGRELGDVVIEKDALFVGVPTSGEIVAKGFATELGREITHVLTISESHKRRKDGRQRSFIATTPEEMQEIAAGKFDINFAEQVAGREIWLIDDSVIRGSTMKSLIQRLRDLGAKGIHVVSGLPRVVRSCDLGYNIQQSQGLLALEGNGEGSSPRSFAEMAGVLGADSIHFISEAGLQDALGENICTFCINGQHPMGRRAS